MKSTTHLDIGACFNSRISLFSLSGSQSTAKDLTSRWSGLLMLQLKLPLMVLLLLFVSIADSPESEVSDELSQFSFDPIFDGSQFVGFFAVN